MGRTGSIDGAEPRRRPWARARGLGHSGASTKGPQAQRQEAESSAGSRRGSKVVPEPEPGPREQEEEGEALRRMPGSPSFRHYCQNTAVVDKIVADAGDSGGSFIVRVPPERQASKRDEVAATNASSAAPTRQASNRDDIAATNADEASQVSEPKAGTRWLKFRGLPFVMTTWYNLFRCHTSKPSTPPPAESQHPRASAASVRPNI